MHYRNRTEVRNWLNRTTWQIACTLTFAESTNGKAAEKLMQQFLARTNRHIYKNAVRKDRGNKGIEVIAIEENNSIGTNKHYHLALNMPKEYGTEYELFCMFLAEVWKENCGNNFIAEFKKAHDSKGWIDYITKGIKGDNCDTINLYSSNVAAADLLIN